MMKLLVASVALLICLPVSADQISRLEDRIEQLESQMYDQSDDYSGLDALAEMSREIDRCIADPVCRAEREATLEKHRIARCESSHRLYLHQHRVGSYSSLHGAGVLRVDDCGSPPLNYKIIGKEVN